MNYFEPFMIPDTEIMNEFFQNTINAIREIEQNHVIVVESDHFAMDFSRLRHFKDEQLALPQTMGFKTYQLPLNCFLLLITSAMETSVMAKPSSINKLVITGARLSVLKFVKFPITLFAFTYQ